MSQSAVANGSINPTGSPNSKDNNPIDGKAPQSKDNSSGQTGQNAAHQPNVRHIPIFVEGRDEPIYNKGLDTTDGPAPRPSPPKNDIPQSNSIFSRVRDIPVKTTAPAFQSANLRRTASPARNIPINVVHTQSNTSTRTHQQQTVNNNSPKQNAQVPPADQRSQSPKPQPQDAITRIQNIQKEVLNLMEKIEKYKEISRKDKEYVYLDEMLTQNLLKLDTIDTEGKETIKAARKEAINCINKCIQVLETKAEKSDRHDKSDESSHQDSNEDQYSPNSSKLHDKPNNQVQENNEVTGNPKLSQNLST